MLPSFEALLAKLSLLKILPASSMLYAATNAQLARIALVHLPTATVTLDLAMLAAVKAPSAIAVAFVCHLAKMVNVANSTSRILQSVLVITVPSMGSFQDTIVVKVATNHDT